MIDPPRSAHSSIRAYELPRSQVGWSQASDGWPVYCRGVSAHVSRDNKTAIELFIAGIRGWEAGLRPLFPMSPDSGPGS